jgi:hypothetical protein
VKTNNVRVAVGSKDGDFELKVFLHLLGEFLAGPRDCLDGDGIWVGFAGS